MDGLVFIYPVVGFLHCIQVSWGNCCDLALYNSKLADYLEFGDCILSDSNLKKDHSPSPVDYVSYVVH